ncbi:NADP-dependent oxidoreductase domain-containing protein [Annulohypoxylon maeteangense]|uniref:NADP-dependent oxidoreductase domain-containing protein n=1 Tax=Annulohypoxylon maeteangense TaxID=1927788 RepID=UPI0020088C69|nr:NADP-dependent oxidoreductase domain-containing protein [Annulohypoxylon maeteangense]KAI0883618.1 NADP-dependent oxidoreductase domain-containing protein [Annulohypoxylon maeteangense]
MSSKTPPKIILGTHTIGDSTKASVTTFDSEEDVQALLDAFYNQGYTHLDTAHDYSLNAPGTSEERLGRAVAASRFTIDTKVHSGHPGDHLPSNIELSVSKSLKALNTSAVETMFLHVPDRHTPFEDTARAMNDAHQQGKFKNFGLSNYAAAEVKRFIEICEEKGYNKPSIYQGHYNALVRGGEKELFPLLREHRMAFYAYSPAAGGFFSGHAGNSSRWKGDNDIAKLYSSSYSKAPVQASLATIQNLADKYGINGHEVALRWTVFHSMLDGKQGDGVIFGVSKIEQLHKTLAAIESGPLPVEIADAVTAIYAAVEGSEPPYHL